MSYACTLPLLQQQLIHHDNHDDHESDDEPIVERRARNLRECVAQHAENERAEHRAHDRAAAAGQARAADDRRGNDVQLVARGQIRLALPLDEHQDDTRDAGEQAGDHVDRCLDPADRDAREERGRLVAADREHRSAPLKRRHQHLEDHREDEQDERRHPIGGQAERPPAADAAGSTRRSTALR